MTSRASRAVGAVVVATLVVSVSGPTLEAQAPAGKAALMNPAEFNEQAPATFQARFETSAGPFVIEVHRDWAPNGADRFYNLVKRGFYDGCRFYRIISGLAQFGINGDPEVAQAWFTARIPDDRRTQSNLKGTIAYSSAGINRRSTQVFINLIDNPGMDVFNAPHGFAPFGRVLSGMNVVESLYNGYGRDGSDGEGTANDTSLLGRQRLSRKRVPEDGLHQDGKHRIVKGKIMRSQLGGSLLVLGTTAVIAMLWGATTPVGGQTPATYKAPRTSDGQPDLNGYWQAVNSANWNIEEHEALPAPFEDLVGAYLAQPAGLSVVEGGTIPYKPEALAE